MNKKFFLNMLLIALFLASILASSPGVSVQAATFTKIYPANKSTGVPAASLSLQWNPYPGVAGVKYQYCLQTKTRCPGGRWINVGTNTSVTVINLLPNTTYYWWVRALDSSNKVLAVADGGSWSFTTAALPGPFGKNSPGNLSSSQPVNNLQLKWGSSSNATRYEVCYDTSNNNICDTSWINAGTNTSYTVSGLSNNAIYYWQVRSVNASGSLQADGGTWWQLSTVIKPDVFSKLGPAPGATNQLANNLYLSWTISATPTDYEYCISLTADECPEGGWKSAGESAYAIVGGLDYDTTYYWQVRANPDEPVYATGGWWSFITQPPPPGPFTKIAPTNGALEVPLETVLSWNASAGTGVSYEFCLDTTLIDPCDEGWIHTNNTSVPVTELGFETVYYWQVRAVNGTGATLATDDWRTFTTITPLKIYMSIVKK
jgi:hypothetical protein